jgi:hypothetical protein
VTAFIESPEGLAKPLLEQDGWTILRSLPRLDDLAAVPLKWKFCEPIRHSRDADELEDTRLSRRWWCELLVGLMEAVVKAHDGSGCQICTMLVKDPMENISAEREQEARQKSRGELYEMYE